jgi:hypothetical protein
MLAEFQQALADLTASPELCRCARQAPGLLRDTYDLSEREWRRLVAIVRHPGMACVCMVYRANRLAPLALNLPRTCNALGAELRPLAEAYWNEFPEGNVHFYIESDRFCRFLKAEIAYGWRVAAGVEEILAIESARVAAALHESHLEAQRMQAA